MHDLVLRKGTLVDGSGDAPYAGDVAIDANLITRVGIVNESGRREIDAAGCWVTPGFIDPHTHLDAQLCWDASGSPSNRHGVTTVVLGLCGFGIAPCRPSGGDELLRTLEVVEEIPYASARQGVPFGWQSWGDYRDYLASRSLGVNVAGFVPHSALRQSVMGPGARSGVADAAERAAMVAALEDALVAGAIGFATSRGPNHVDFEGRPVPSRLADEAELRALVSACAGRLWQINVETKFSRDATALIAELERYVDWTRAADARLTWTPCYAEPGEPVWRSLLEHNDALNRSGVRVAPQVTAVPITLMLRFDERSVFTAMLGWEEALDGYDRASKAERKERLTDAQVRAAMKRGGGDPRHPLHPDLALWHFTVAPSRPEIAGNSVAEVASREGLDPVDLLCDQIVRDDLATLVEVPVLNRGEEGVLALLEDRHTLLGLGDSGAHVMSVTNYRYPTFLLAQLVLREARLKIERAIALMTSEPATLLGLDDRGLLAPGMAADVVVIDPERLALGPARIEYDLPGDAPRLVQAGTGFRAVFVNGVETITGDRPTGAAPGRVLRAGGGPSTP